MACTSGCPTPGAHATWGECLRAKGTKVAFCGIGGGDASAQKKWDSDLAAYKDARRQGVQPSGTSRVQVETAMKISEMTGTAYTA